MENKILPSGLTTEYDCKMKIFTEKAGHIVLSQAHNQLELTFDIDGLHRNYRTTFTDLVKIMDKADTELSQSRQHTSMPLKDQLGN